MIEKYPLNIIILLERYKSIICINKILIKRQIKHAQKNRKKRKTLYPYHMHLYLKCTITCKIQLCIEKVESNLYLFYFKFKINSLTSKIIKFRA